jgi:hypothetical protein
MELLFDEIVFEAPLFFGDTLANLHPAEKGAEP